MPTARHLGFLAAAALALSVSDARGEVQPDKNCEYPVADLAKCPPCPAPDLCRKAAPGFCPDINGCGPKKFTSLIENGVIPQGYGEADFRNGGCQPIPEHPTCSTTPLCGCNRHDHCYGECNHDKSDCDQTFRREMHAECNRKYPYDPHDRCDIGCDWNHYAICHDRAELYYRAVSSSVGKTAYEDSQKEACECCCSFTPPSRPRDRVPAVAGSAALVCEPPTWTGTASNFVTGAFATTSIVTWTYDPSNSSPGLFSYSADGSVEVTNTLYNDLGCSVTPTQFTITQEHTLSNNLTVFYGVDPPSYGGMGIIIRDITVTCPGQPPLIVSASYTWFSGTGSVSSSGLSIEASGTTSQGGYAYSFHAQ
jgi:hypothetical protein